MNEIEDKYALFNLTEDERSRLVQLAQFALPPIQNERHIVVETVVVQGGDRTVIKREERSA